MDYYRDKLMNFLKKSRSSDIFVFDTETTGIPGKSPVVDILEFSCIKLSLVDGIRKITNSLDIYINPGYPVPAEILEFNAANGTGITQEKIDREGVSKEKAVEMISNFWGEHPFIMGYNSVSFDEPLVKDLYKNSGMVFNPAGHLDVLRMAKEKFPSKVKGPKMSHKLSDMVALLGCENAGFHEAIEDVKATFEVFKKLVPMYAEPENPEEPYLSIDNFRIINVSPFKKSYQLRRIYVINSTGAKVYYDLYNRLWIIPGHLPEDEVLPRIYAYVGVKNDREFDDYACQMCR